MKTSGRRESYIAFFSRRGAEDRGKPHRVLTTLCTPCLKCSLPQYRYPRMFEYGWDPPSVRFSAKSSAKANKGSGILEYRFVPV
jgi:hypothetical protein